MTGHGVRCAVAGVVLVVAHATTGAHAAQPRNEVAYYVERYGEILAKQDPRVARTHEVFRQVRAAADTSSKRLPRLVVVDSDDEPWAIALPDGHIVLSRQAVQICHQLGDRTDACLAFVLGHELAHLANDDFWHREVHGFLATAPDTRRIASFLRENRRVEEIELAADDKGYIFAAMAGFHVASLLDQRPGEPGFFEHWLEQTNSRVTAPGTSADARSAVLRRRLADVDSKLGFFHFGTWLAHFDYCDDGVYFLREFQKVYPGREVLGNLGYCYLQMARQAMKGERAYFYWMPLQLDGETRAAALSTRGDRTLKSLHEATGDHDRLLEQAVEYLEAAAEADPSYLPARINLGVAHLYLGRPHQARAAIEEALRIAPQDTDALALAALALYEQGDADLDLWPRAVSKLEALVARSPGQEMLRYNLARLLELRGRQGDAHTHWQVVATSSRALPAAVRAVACQQQRDAGGACAAATGQTAGARAPWTWPLEVSGFAPVSQAMLTSTLAGWEETPFDWRTAKLYGRMYRQPDGEAAVLELDGFVQMQMVHLDRAVTVQELRARCGAPLRQRIMPVGTVWSCGSWAALVRGDTVRQAWWIAG